MLICVQRSSPEDGCAASGAQQGGKAGSGHGGPPWQGQDVHLAKGGEISAVDQLSHQGILLGQVMSTCGKRKGIGGGWGGRGGGGTQIAKFIQRPCVT